MARHFRNPRHVHRLAVGVFWAVVLGFAASAFPADTDALQRLVGERDAVMLVNPQHETVLALHADLPLVPASILKLLTVLSAFHDLHPDYRFRTEFFESHGGDLIVKGYGDPFLTSEVLRDVAMRIAQVKTVFRDLVLDDSFFSPAISIDGIEANTEPYNAPPGALCVNFNTVAFRRAGKRGKPESADPDLPLTPVAIRKIQQSRLSSGRITVANDRQGCLRYAGEAIRAMLQRSGVTFQGKIRLGQTDTASPNRMLLRYSSQMDLEEMAAKLLEYSSNFIANQIFLTMGAELCGAPATLEKSRRMVDEYVRQALGGADIVMVEGSGISRLNRIRAKDMDRILALFAPYRHLMRRKDGQWFKTGTLDGVRNRVGFMEDAQGGIWRFVVMLNEPGKRTDGIMQLLRPGEVLKP
ncbi:D-alanyl-D-alanine carboxypeptidase/D-alanyl-D-alanine-endopeptidase [Desulfatirhabdium butyrativorans]|uniref:D-alanyl-D-alanine carboxypeptidase/D-alanyl-D-alanine-endopeptidase n=1 Tax=Desulfatirhabdium butyrativorans TaxID=340467 RepID=UPI0004041275|nr:D-alanyl-D-alanine carboxypeptidase [Desulfatirhabdium butyrativorans]